MPIPNYFHVFYALLQLRRCARRRLRPIQSRAVTLCKLDNLEIVPKWSHIRFSLLFYRRSELCDKFVVSQYFHDVLREMDLSNVSKSILVLFCGLSVGRKTGSARTTYNAFRPLCHTLRELSFRKYFTHTHLKVLTFPMLRIMSCDFSLKGVYAYFCLRSAFNASQFESFGLVDQLFDCFLTCVIFLLSCRMEQPLNPIVDFTGAGLPALSRMALDALSSMRVVS